MMNMQSRGEGVLQHPTIPVLLPHTPSTPKLFAQTQARLLSILLNMRPTMFASMLAAVCASPHRWIEQSASSAIIPTMQPALPTTHTPPVSIPSFSSVAQSRGAIEAALSTTLPSSSPASVPPSDYAATVVKHHNAHRANHSAPEIAWDDALAATAYKIARSCVYAHDTYVSSMM